MPLAFRVKFAVMGFMNFRTLQNVAQKTSNRFRLFSIFTLMFQGAIAFADMSPGPHGGDIIGEGPNQFEIKVDKKGHAVDVYTLGKKKTFPKVLDLTLFRDSDTGETIKLTPINLHGTATHYRGSLAPNQGSYIGLELKIETSFKSFKILRKMPQLPVRNEP